MAGRTMLAVTALTMGAALLLATAAMAKKIPDIEILSAARGHLLVCPAGDGPTLADSGLTVTLRLSTRGLPLQGFWGGDLWIMGATRDVPASCGWAGPTGDGLSDEDGILVVSGGWSAGGHTQSGLVIYADGVAMNEADPPVPALPILVNSPDIDGNGVVNLADAGLFAQDMLHYDVRSDFVLNGAVDLVDLAVLVGHIGHGCQ